MPFTAPKPISPAPDDLRGAKVLVVDDERSWRVILETDLRMLGYKVTMAEDADQALERASSESPEVAIIDLMLPEPMDGWGLLSELRNRGQNLPVIFYTAYPVFPSGTDDPDVVGYMSKAICTPFSHRRSGALASAGPTMPRLLPEPPEQMAPHVDEVGAGGHAQCCEKCYPRYDADNLGAPGHAIHPLGFPR